MNGKFENYDKEDIRYYLIDINKKEGIDFTFRIKPLMEGHLGENNPQLYITSTYNLLGGYNHFDIEDVKCVMKALMKRTSNINFGIIKVITKRTIILENEEGEKQ